MINVVLCVVLTGNFFLHSVGALNEEIKGDIGGANASGHLLAFSVCCTNLEQF